MQNVVYRLQEYFEHDVDPPLPSELAGRGDFSIFIDGVNKRDIGAGLVRTALPTVFPGYEAEPLRAAPPIPKQSLDYVMSEAPFDHIATSAEEPSPIEGVVEGVRSGSMDIDTRYRGDLSPAIGLAAQRGGSFRGSPFGGIGGGAGPSTHSPSSSISSIRGGPLSRINSSHSGPGVGYSPEFFPTTQRIGQTHSRPSTSGTSGPPGTLGALPGMSKKVKPNYSWSELVDRENLDVRPGEVEILPKDFEMMCVYTLSIRHSKPRLIIANPTEGN